MVGPQWGIWKSNRQEKPATTSGLGIRERVRFLGSVANGDLPEWYRASDVFVLANAQEGWPKVVSEVQVGGVPTVATECAWDRDGIARGGEGRGRGIR